LNGYFSRFARKSRSNLRNIAKSDGRYLRKWIKPRWEAYFLKDTKFITAEDWLHAFRVSNGTKAKIRNVMSAVFRHSIQYGFLPRHEGSNPIKYARQSAAINSIPTILTKAQAWSITTRLREPTRTMAFLAAFMG
jgi:hypothetical protein